MLDANTVAKSDALHRGRKQFGTVGGVRASLPSAYQDAMMARIATVSGILSALNIFIFVYISTIIPIHDEFHFNCTV